jgi:hypothetical protein
MEVFFLIPFLTYDLDLEIDFIIFAMAFVFLVEVFITQLRIIIGKDK